MRPGHSSERSGSRHSRRRPVFRIPDYPDEDAETALRQGLRSLHAPIPSDDFDGRVLDQLSRRDPWGRKVWSLVWSWRPAFGAAAVTVPLALILISLLGRVPAPFVDSPIPQAA